MKIKQMNSFINNKFQKAISSIVLFSEYLRTLTYDDYLEYKNNDGKKTLLAYGTEKFLNKVFKYAFIGFLITTMFWGFKVISFSFGNFIGFSIGYWLLEQVVTTIKRKGE